MADNRIAKGIPNLFNGVSQQAPSLRLPSQAEVQINGYSSLVDGLTKRPPLVHVAELRASAADDAYIHVINRDVTERYIAVLLDGSIEAYDMDGNEVPVYQPAVTYLNVNTPREDYAAVTIADHTIIVNKTITVAMDTTETKASVPKEAYVFVKRGHWGTTYTVTLNGTACSVNTPNPSSGSATYYSTVTIATDLRTAILASFPTWTVTRTGSTLKITAASSADFTFSALDSYGDDAMIGMKLTTQSEDDLPSTFFDDAVLKVVGETLAQDDDYYVKYETEAGYATGTWKEYRGWDQYNGFNVTKMPHKLVRMFVTGSEPAGALKTWITNEGLEEGDVYFYFQPITWDTRQVGDTTTAPEPSFVGSTINDIFFFRNRLGFLSDENVIMSEAGEFFNFWPKSVKQALDTDPIDVAVSHNKVSILYHAIPFHKTLLLFSDQTQFQVAANETLTPLAIKIDQTTEFEGSSLVKPVASGPNVYFAVETGDYVGIRELYVSEESSSTDASLVTGHVPQYLPAGVFKIAASSNEDMLAVLSTGVRNKIWVYKYYWSGQEKLQSSWSEFVLETGAKILDVAFLADYLYVIVDRGGAVYLEKMSFQSGEDETEDVGFLVHLDRLCSVTGVYDSGTNTTTWTLPYDEDGDIALVYGEDFAGKVGAAVINTTRPTDGTVAATGNYSAGHVYAGLPYETRYTFSQIYVKEGGESPVAILTGSLTLHRFSVVYTESGEFSSEVSIEGRSSDSVTRKTGRLGSNDYIIGSPVIDSGVFRFSVQGVSENIEVSLINDSYFPSQWQSAEWEGSFATLERRV